MRLRKSLTYRVATLRPLWLDWRISTAKCWIFKRDCWRAAKNFGGKIRNVWTCCRLFKIRLVLPELSEILYKSKSINSSLLRPEEGLLDPAIKPVAVTQYLVGRRP